MIVIEKIRINDFIIVDLVNKEAPITVQIYDGNELCKAVKINEIGKVSLIVKNSIEGVHDIKIRKDETFIGRRRFIIKKKKSINQRIYTEIMNKEIIDLIRGTYEKKNNI